MCGIFGIVCASERGADNIAETLSIAGTKGVELMPVLIGDLPAPVGLEERLRGEGAVFGGWGHFVSWDRSDAAAPS